MDVWKYTIYRSDGSLAAEETCFETKSEAEGYAGLHANMMRLTNYKVVTAKEYINI